MHVGMEGSSKSDLSHLLPIGVVIAYVTIIMQDLDREKPALTIVEPNAIPSKAW